MKRIKLSDQATWLSFIEWLIGGAGFRGVVGGGQITVAGCWLKGEIERRTPRNIG